jgi:hypothetical protein
MTAGKEEKKGVATPYTSKKKNPRSLNPQLAKRTDPR